MHEPLMLKELYLYLLERINQKAFKHLGESSAKVFLKNFVLENKLKGIDRIVPLGQSLDIGFKY